MENIEIDKMILYMFEKKTLRGGMALVTWTYPTGETCDGTVLKIKYGRTVKVKDAEPMMSWSGILLSHQETISFFVGLSDVQILDYVNHFLKEIFNDEIIND